MPLYSKRDMKKSRLVGVMFSLIVGLYNQASFSKAIFIDQTDDTVVHRLGEVVNQRPEFFQQNGWNTFRVEFENGNTYFLASSLMYRNNPNYTGHGYPGGRGWCEFDFFDSNYRYVNGIRVNIRDHNDTNVCNWIYGVSAVTYKGQPTLLTAVQYHRGIDPAKTMDQIGTNFHRFTALLVLTPHPDGSLSIRQDDSCLGPMNQIAELAVAKKRVAECNRVASNLKDDLKSEVQH